MLTSLTFNMTFAASRSWTSANWSHRAGARRSRYWGLAANFPLVSFAKAKEYYQIKTRGKQCFPAQ
jgi:hypothetical protein